VEELVFNQTLTLDAKRFQRILGTLMHLLLGTRPNISYTLTTLGRHAANLGFEHLHAFDRLSQCLRGTADHKLIYRSGVTEGDTLVGYIDVDCGSNHRSTAGTEAEHIATMVAIWLRRFFAGLHQPITLPISLRIDNQSAIATARNLVFHYRAKHHQSFRHKVERGDNGLDHVLTTPQLVDVLTKGLS